jgi:hypothetical protein
VKGPLSHEIGVFGVELKDHVPTRAGANRAEVSERAQRDTNPSMSSEPGLDLHEWESIWADLDDAAANAPDETLPEMVRLVQQMLDERGFDLHEPITAEGEEPEILRSFLAARELVAVLDAGGEVEPEAIADAIEDVRAVHDHVVAGRAAP